MAGRPARPPGRCQPLFFPIPVGPENVEEEGEPAKAQHGHHAVYNPHY